MIRKSTNVGTGCTLTLEYFRGLGFGSGSTRTKRLIFVGLGFFDTLLCTNNNKIH